MNPTQAVHEVIWKKSFARAFIACCITGCTVVPSTPGDTSCGFCCGACNSPFSIIAKLPCLLKKIGLSGCVQSRWGMNEEALSPCMKRNAFTADLSSVDTSLACDVYVLPAPPFLDLSVIL